MTGGKTKYTPTLIRTNRAEESAQSIARSAAKVGAEGDGVAYVKGAFLGTAAIALPSEPSERLLPHALHGNTLPKDLPQDPPTFAGLGESCGDLQRLIDLQLLLSRATTTTGRQGQILSYREPVVDRVPIMALVNSPGSLEAHNLLRSSQGMLSPRVNQADLSQHLSSLSGTNSAPDAILASLLAQEPAQFAARGCAPLALSTTYRATAARQLLGPGLYGQRTASALTSANFPKSLQLPSDPSFLHAQRVEINRTATEHQLLQLYLLERERYLRHENQLGNGESRRR
jgi:hypothetical protein